MTRLTLLLGAFAREGREELSAPTAPNSKPASLARCSSTSGSSLTACREEALLLGAAAVVLPGNESTDSTIVYVSASKTERSLHFVSKYSTGLQSQTSHGMDVFLVLLGST